MKLILVMSNKKKCKIDCVHVSLRYTPNTIKKLTFDEILKHKEINDKEYIVNGKSIHFSVIEDNENYLVGFIRTTIDKDLPAKINKKNKKISALDVSSDEGVVFGNVLLYSKQLNILFYEVNKNSIYLEVFNKFIFICFRSSTNLKEESIFDIHFSTIFKKNEYQRALSMNNYKSFHIKVYQPKKFLDELKKLNSTMEDKVEFDFTSEVERAANLNSDFAEIEYKVERSKKTDGLYKNKIETIIKKLSTILKYNQVRQNIQSIEICGYTTECPMAQTPVDLIGDVYFTSFKLEVPRLDTDLQKDQRVKLIKEVYQHEFPILETYL